MSLPHATDAASIEALCRSLAPADLAGVPLYVLLASELPEDRGRLVRSYGWTGPVLDLEFRDVLESRAKWAGRGGCVVLNDLLIRERHPLDADEEIIDTAIHELAHLFDRPKLYADAPELEASPALAVRQSRRLAALMAAEADAESERERQEREARQHDPQFVRIATHLLDRAARLGVYLSHQAVAAGELREAYYGPRAHVEALGEELDDMADATFAEIRNAPMPPALVELWTAEVEGRRIRRRQTTKEIRPCPPHART